MNQKRVWLITGCSSGLGHALAVYAANKGDQVVGTVRNENQIGELENLVPDRIKAVLMDVRNKEQVKAGVEVAKKSFGKIDVLVNNAGYGSIGPVEAISEEEVKRQFEVNVFGPIFLSKLVIPIMREQMSGHIINISSIAGLRGTPGLGIYNASKFALEGLGEALSLELSESGISVTNIEPGPFRTKWAGESATYAQNDIADYEQTAGRLMSKLSGYSGEQPGSPEKAAAAIYAATELVDPPVHLPLGDIAYQAVYSKIDALKKEVQDFEYLGRPTDYESDN